MNVLSKVLGVVVLLGVILATSTTEGSTTVLRASGGAPACDSNIKVPIAACPDAPGSACVDVYTKYGTGSVAYITSRNTTQCPVSVTCLGKNLSNWDCTGCISNCVPSNYGPGSY